ncbi:MAG: hypothetical protein KF819_34230 [Labilithrix sp.]|nr:hypothetical protein [Labilithrix sp.]
MAPLRFLRWVPIALALVGCQPDTEHASMEATMRADGYALFRVGNDRQQRNEIEIRLREVEPGTTFVLLYSGAPGGPRSSGWFLFDPKSVERCGGSIGAHCEVPDGFGHMVDVVTVPENASEIVLRTGLCGCDADRASKDWSAYLAVMRVERTGRTVPLSISVTANKIETRADEPEISQIQ